MNICLIQAAVNLTWTDYISIGVVLICIAALFNWLVRPDRPYLLENTPTRRHRLSVVTPFLILGFWFGTMLIAQIGIQTWADELDEARRQFITYAILAGIEGVMAVGLIIFGYFLFARRLRGMGLNIRTLPGDFAWGLLNYLTILPLVQLCLLGVMFVGERIYGPDFNIARHEGLLILSENTNPYALGFLILAFTVITPVFEEVLFRGYLQTAFRGQGLHPWAAIGLSSVIFATIHANPSHWIALFVLSLGIGYAYERSGSLIRSIVIHGLFNLVSVTATLLGPVAG